MKITEGLSYKNCVRRPGRTIALAVLAALLCFSLLAGFLVNSGLNNGLRSLETRLGADIMVVPYEATTQYDFENMILQGNPGYFYMNKGLADKIISREGIGEASYQIYLASLGAGCCSAKLQLIGFDPKTDFTITPWIGTREKTELKSMEVLVGSAVNAFTGDKLQFYGTIVRVAGRLDETGTYLDSAVYADQETIKTLIINAEESKTFKFDKVDPDKVVSCILINVADGYLAEEVMNDINIHVDGVKAIKTQSMISDISGKLTGIAGMTRVMVAVIWGLVIVIMMMAFSMVSNERKKEFAILRVIGASRKKLFFIILKENLLVSTAGSVAGAVLAATAGALSNQLIGNALGIPFLLPDTGNLILLALAATAVSIAAASLSSAVSANKISKVDAALILRGEN